MTKNPAVMAVVGVLLVAGAVTVVHLISVKVG